MTSPPDVPVGHDGPRLLHPVPGRPETGHAPAHPVSSVPGRESVADTRRDHPTSQPPCRPIPTPENAKSPPVPTPPQGPPPPPPCLGSKRVPPSPDGTGLEEVIPAPVRSTPRTDRWCLQLPTTMRYHCDIVNPRLRRRPAPPYADPWHSPARPQTGRRVFNTTNQTIRTPVRMLKNGQIVGPSCADVASCHRPPGQRGVLDHPPRSRMPRRGSRRSCR